MQGKTKLARIKYHKALKLVDRAFELEGEEQVAAASQLKASCLLNLARCAEREQEWGEALGWCNKAIRWGRHVAGPLMRARGGVVSAARLYVWRPTVAASCSCCPPGLVAFRLTPSLHSPWLRFIFAVRSLRCARSPVTAASAAGDQQQELGCPRRLT